MLAAPETDGDLRAELAALRARVAELERREAAHLAALSERARMEEELRRARAELEQQVAERTAARARSEEFLRTLYEGAPLAIFVVDVEPDGDFRYADVNAAHQRLVGLAPAELIGRRLEEVARLSPEQVAGIRANYTRCLRADGPIQYEEQLTVNGSETWWLSLLWPLHDAAGRTYRIIGVCLDISERRRMEEQLRFQARVLDAVGQAVVAVRPDRTIAYWNRAAETMYGWRATEVLGRPISEVFLTKRSQPRAAQFMEQMLAGESWSGEYTVQRRDGADVHVLATDVAILDERGELAMLVGITADVTPLVTAQQALREREAMLRAFYESAPLRMGVVELLDDDVLFLSVNKEFAQLFGLSAASFEGRRSREIWAQLRAQSETEIPEEPNDIIAWLDYYRQAWESRQPITFEAEETWPDGNRWLHATVAPIPDPAAPRPRCCFVVMDITARKQAEITLHQYKHILSATLDGIALVDQNYVYRVVNDEYLRRSMKQYDEIVGHSVAEVMGAQVFQQVVQPEFDRCLAGEIIRYQSWFDFPGEGRRFLDVTYVPYRDGQGAISGVLVSSRDITELTWAEEALREANAELEYLNRQLRRSRDLLHALFDGLDDGLLLLDRSGGVLNVNRTMAALLGRVPRELVGRHWAMVCSDLNPLFPGALALATLHDGQRRAARERLTTPSGDVRVFDMQTLPLLGGDQQVDQVIVHLVDVTAQLQMQEHMIEIEGFAAAGRLAASVAHEINTPLQAVMNGLYFAQSADNDTRTALLAVALDEVKRTGQIVQQLLDLYRSPGRQAGAVAINDLLERLLLLLGKRIKEQGVRLVRDMAERLPPVLGRSDELTQVLLNLLVNALDAMPQGGMLHLQTRYEPPAHDSGGRVSIAIHDTGEGIEPDLLPRIFEPFVTSKERGTGMGLAISRQIVERHGGSIHVDSQPASGTVFTISLPMGGGRTNDQTAHPAS